MNRFDAGILLGLGLTKSLSAGILFIEGEYMIGKSNIHKSDSAMFPYPTEISNRSFFFSAGYIIKIGKTTCY